MRVWPDAVEAVADLIQAFTGAGVSLQPAITSFGPDEGYETDPEAPVLIKGYVPGVLPAARRRALRRAVVHAGLASALAAPLRYASLREEDWAETWKAFYAVDRLGRVVVRPAWLPYDPSPGDAVVSLDPGVAFGTGQHPTTRMCLLLLQDYLAANDRVIDVGTGSGILAIAAVQLGASACLAFDTEELAVKAARANVDLNGLAARIRVEPGSIEVAAGEPPFDLCLANINAATITALAPALHRCLRPGGVLVASGIIEAYLAGCEAALIEAGFAIEKRLTDGDWRALAARR